MPELPEVETVRRGLEPAMAGAVFAAVEMLRPDLRFPLPKGFVRRLKGARVQALSRRGKYLTAPLSSGETLIMHLGMSGRFSVSARDRRNREILHSAGPTDPAHDHVRFFMQGPAGDARIDYNDPRRFGFMDLVETAALDRSRHFLTMGPEPLGPEFTIESFKAALKRRSAPLKAVLLDQSVIAGIGNIYACEALFAARVSPRRKARNISTKGAERLHCAIQRTLVAAIEDGGSSLRDFAGSDGALGYFQRQFAVYDREGQACLVCNAPIQRIAQSGRSTFFCGKCQR